MSAFLVMGLIPQTLIGIWFLMLFDPVSVCDADVSLPRATASTAFDVEVVPKVPWSLVAHVEIMDAYEAFEFAHVFTCSTHFLTLAGHMTCMSHGTAGWPCS